MRDIIFRGKRLQLADWVEGYFYKSDRNKRERESGKATLIFTPDCDTFIYVPKWKNSVMVFAETVGQQVGKQDKNGKEIFENDIVICEYVGIQYPAKVVYKNGSFGVEYEHNGIEYFNPFTSFIESAEFEIIGNVTDNPELLNSTTGA